MHSRHPAWQRTVPTTLLLPRLGLRLGLRSTSFQGSTAIERCELRHTLGAGSMSLCAPVPLRVGASRLHPTKTRSKTDENRLRIELRDDLVLQPATYTWPQTNRRRAEEKRLLGDTETRHRLARQARETS